MNITQFRASVKEQFDKAAQGEVIQVERGGLIFQLVTIPESITHGVISGIGTLSKVSVTKVPIEKIIKANSKPTGNKDYGILCEHGAGKGFCKFSKCKFFNN